MFTIWVPGKPQPQGSKKGFIINNKVVLVESSKGLKPWRDKIRIVAQHSPELQEFTGAVHVSLSFYFKKPASNKKLAHTQKPDVDKLIRGCLDALTGVTFKDDSQVTSITAYKFWAKTEMEGVNISVWPVDEDGISA
jgi:Holliday junction resolvase RusA-like endonuclease